MFLENSDDARQKTRRGADEVRAWLPLVLSLVSTILMIGIIYGHMGGRLDLIEYRLEQIEKTIRH
jgi:hypothetical protein